MNTPDSQPEYYQDQDLMGYLDRVDEYMQEHGITGPQRLELKWILLNIYLDDREKKGSTDNNN